LELTSNPTPLPSTQLCYTQALVHVREYARAVHALALSTPATPFDETAKVLRLLHPLVEVDLPPFVDDFHLEMEVTLKWEVFVFALACSSCLSSGGPQVWCMSFHKTILSQMILRVVSTFFLKYVGTLFEVIFHL
jgi:hypothetical protein